MEKLTFLELTEQEQAEAMNLLKESIKYNKITFNKEHANPLQEYCYISSSSVPGLYYPNSELHYIEPQKDAEPPFYKVRAIGKTEKHGIGLVLARQDAKILEQTTPETMNKYFAEFKIIPFNDIIYSRGELAIIEALNNDIKYYKNEIYWLEKIKYKKLASGKYSNNILKCIDAEPEKNIHISAKYESSSCIKLYFSELKTSQAGYEFNNYYDIAIFANIENQTWTPDILTDAIIKLIESHKKQITSLKNDLKNVRKIAALCCKYYQTLNRETTYTTRQAIKNNLYYFEK